MTTPERPPMPIGNMPFEDWKLIYRNELWEWFLKVRGLNAKFERFLKLTFELERIRKKEQS